MVDQTTRLSSPSPRPGDDELITKYLEPDPNRSGRFDVRLKNYGVHVWALVGYHHATAANVDKVADAYRLPREAVEAAFAYYRRHPAVIDARIDANTDEDAL